MVLLFKAGLLNKYVSSPYYVLGTFLSVGDTSVNKHFLWRICSLLSKDNNCAKEEEWNCKFKSDHMAVCNNSDH